MKRWTIRLTALSGICVLGLIAIAHAQRDGGADDSTPQADAGNPFSLNRNRPMRTPQTVATDQSTQTPPRSESEARFLGSDDTPRKIPENPMRRGAPGQQPSMFSALPAAATNPFGPSGASTAKGGTSTEPGRFAAPADAGPLLKPAGEPQVVTAAASDDGTVFAPRSRISNKPAPAAPLPMDDRDAKPLAGDALFAPANGPALGPAGTVSVMKRNQGAGPAPFGQAGPSAPPEKRDSNDGPSFLPPVINVGSDGIGRPGDKQLEGSQSPHLTIEKTAPPEVQVGKPAKFAIKVRNAGNVAADGVEIHDQVPQGTQLVSTNPPASQTPGGELVWSLGTLRPNEEAIAQMEVMPSSEGEIGSVASVTFRASASARATVTRPQLVMEVSSPKQVMIGGDVTLSIKLSNPGTGAATGVVLAEKVPAALRHPAGGELEFEVGTLKPGETRQIDLTMGAAQAGHVVNLLTAHGDAKLRAEQRADLEIIAPALQVAMTGPTRRYLERQATYTVSVSNPGTAPAKDVELITELPRGLQFVKANNSGHYDPNTRTVSWSLDELPAAETGTVTLVAMPTEAGEQKLKVVGKAKQGLSDEKEQSVVVEGLALIGYDIQPSDEAVEIGGETSYQIHVVNQGSKAADNVQVAVAFPAELQAIGGQGPSRESLHEHDVQFEPLPHLAPKGEATFRVRAKAIKAGDLRVKVQLQTDEMRQPVTKEACTRVYADQ